MLSSQKLHLPAIPVGEMALSRGCLWFSLRCLIRWPGSIHKKKAILKKSGLLLADYRVWQIQPSLMEHVLVLKENFA